MFDIWGFLLQTLTVSGAAVLILIIKVLFKDKLPPKWQFAVWGVLGILMLIPAGIGGRYSLIRWQLPVEVVKSWFGIYSFTQVLFPIPVITSVPNTVVEWIFAVYVLGVVMHALMYAISYVKLRYCLRIGNEPSEQKMSRIQEIASEHGIKLCRVIEVKDLSGAFVCGIIRPVLVIPVGRDIDNKIVLHELFHLKNKDTLWSVIICAFRCLHWCNPLIVYCAGRAINDMESRCDQYVLGQLEGEERREYGHILLSMANERFSKTFGSTCINNGAKNIKERIENIARFKKYPHGMGLVSVCVVILLALPLIVGVQAGSFNEIDNSVRLSLASARSTPCTTPAGAFDAYGKSVLERNGYYRAMCAPESMQEDIQKEMLEKEGNFYPIWDPGLEEWARKQSGYFIYNLKQCQNNAYEGMLVVELAYPPNGKAEEINMMYLATQNLRVEKQNGRWVVIPLEDFRHVETLRENLAWGCTGLPGVTYSGKVNTMLVELTFQTIHIVDSTETEQSDNFLFGSSSYYDTEPKPNAEFTSASRSHNVRFTCDEADRNKITDLGLSVVPVYEGQERPTKLMVPSGDHTVHSSSTGEMMFSIKPNQEWGSTVELGGSGGSVDPRNNIVLPQFYVADLYINNEKVAQLDLTLQKEGAK